MRCLALINTPASDYILARNILDFDEIGESVRINIRNRHGRRPVAILHPNFGCLGVYFTGAIALNFLSNSMRFLVNCLNSSLPGSSVSCLILIS